MKKNLILNSITLFLTTLIIVLVVFAWYLANDTASTNSIFAGTEDADYTLKLQRGTYDDSSETWTWTDTNSLSISNIQPGDSFFFRVIITTTRTINFNMQFAGIESEVDSSITALNDYIYIGSSKRYNIVNNAVTVTSGNASKTLYTVSEDEISLGDYKVEDTFRFYSYGVCTTSPATVTSPVSNVTVTYNSNPLDDDVTNDGITPTELGRVETNYAVTSSGSETIAFAYFALEFNDAASIVDYLYTFDGVTKTCSDSNLYQSQKLSIGKINVLEA